jgi:integrase
MANKKNATNTKNSEKVFNVKGCQYRGDNTYRMVVYRGFKPDGSRDRKSKTVTATSEKELIKLYGQFVVEVEKGLFINTTNITFKVFVENQWMIDNEVKNLAPKTLARYKSMLERIYTAIGHIQLQKINQNHIVQFYNNLMEDGVA